jgi:hypothetical protein
MTKHERANAIFIVMEAFDGIKRLTTSSRVDELCVIGLERALLLGDEVKRELQEVKDRKIDPTG